jgi:LexA-binding, inner membrane-associated putative hydrolase
MLIWFVALSMTGVVLVFRDPRLDHRMVALGSVLPLAIDLLVGLARGSATQVGPAHSMVMHVAVLAVVMLATIGRRPIRKRLVAVSIGGFAHLVLDGAWTRTTSFAWPLLGARSVGREFVFDRPLIVNVVMELLGGAVFAFLVHRCRLRQKSRREGFVRSGILEFLPPPPRRR